jgi:hypothetical protein
MMRLGGNIFADFNAILVNEHLLVSGGFDTPFAIAQGYSTTEPF